MSKPVKIIKNGLYGSFESTDPFKFEGYDYKSEMAEEAKKFQEEYETVTVGCPNESCYCTGKCLEVKYYIRKSDGKRFDSAMNLLD